ncbi:MAG: hypothetical protein KBH21_00285 [Acetoanaerobium sp.]|nr:hypothetical protein [Acetoanaerobium sp.]
MKELKVFVVPIEYSPCNAEDLDNGTYYEEYHHRLTDKVEQFIIAALEYGNVLSMMDFISSFNNEEINDEKFYIYITNNYL